MVSTNHFRGRKLGGNLRSPVSPRRPHVDAVVVIPPPPPGFNTWDIDADFGDGPSTVASHTSAPTETSPNNWAEFGTDQQGNSFALLILYDDFNLQISTQYVVDQGSGFNVLAVIDPLTWDGVSETEFPPANWVATGMSASGTIIVKVPY
jgi:hypothetical protein